jgi:hypothetical protein
MGDRRLRVDATPAAVVIMTITEFQRNSHEAGLPLALLLVISLRAQARPLRVTHAGSRRTSSCQP